MSAAPSGLIKRYRPHNFALTLGLGLALTGFGCGRAPDPATGQGPPRTSANTGSHAIDLPQAEARPGAAVVILVDTSGSMGQTVPDRGGKKRAKNLIARDALERIIDHTAKWKKEHPDRPLQMGIYTFSSSTREVLPIGDFDPAKARAALDDIPKPNSGTAIGRAMEEGAKALYRSGAARKYIVCITDGENTSGPQPLHIAQQLHAQTEGGIELNFVAFDTSSKHFDFVKAVKGHVVQASDGEQLQGELTKIYDKRILVEAEEPQRK